MAVCGKQIGLNANYQCYTLCPFSNVVLDVALAQLVTKAFQISFADFVGTDGQICAHGVCPTQNTRGAGGMSRKTNNKRKQGNENVMNILDLGNYN